MCGIAGILGRVDDDNRAALGRMTAAMLHRGPDDGGHWESAADLDGWGCLHGFRRLAILDLTPAAHQPMTDPVTGHTMVFNGEIYSYAELRRQLVADGQSFASSGDSAVLLRLLRRRARHRGGGDLVAPAG
jgi:asparagine synthase (glutamine-hydrolysing)